MIAIQISDDILKDIKFSIEELQLEFAAFLYDKNKVTLEQGSKIANIDILSFQQELGKRKIFTHYELSDFNQDIETLKRLKRIPF